MLQSISSLRTKLEQTDNVISFLLIDPSVVGCEILTSSLHLYNLFNLFASVSFDYLTVRERYELSPVSDSAQIREARLRATIPLSLSLSLSLSLLYVCGDIAYSMLNWLKSDK